ncbi:MAG: hypothetical protein GKR94_07205 [Gammaproteobacteria bacterium]|nr:hypothetical protein [Gammaproteobacteria bacterium]
MIVERLVTNPEGSFYRVYFCGRQIIIAHAFTSGLIKKLSGNPRDTNHVSEMDYMLDGSDGLSISSRLKREVAIFVQRSPIDYGCLDIMHDGWDNYYVIDPNLTPTGAAKDIDSRLLHFLKHGILHPPNANRGPSATFWRRRLRSRACQSVTGEINRAVEAKRK